MQQLLAFGFAFHVVRCLMESYVGVLQVNATNVIRALIE
jgi:hypothetical protein